MPRADDRCLHELFEAQAARSPDTVAVRSPSGSLSYAELDPRANRLAHHLRALGVGPDDRSRCCAERGPRWSSALLAVLKAGGAYVPLDPAYPAERLRYMLADAAPAVVLTRGPSSATAVAGADRPCRATSTPSSPEPAPAGQPAAARAAAGADNLAYVIYTSGSTGRPKGVMNDAPRHRQPAAVDAATPTGWPPATRVLQKTPSASTCRCGSSSGRCVVGARLVLARPGGHRDPAYLARPRSTASGVTTVHFVPSMLHAFLAAPARPSVGRAAPRVICSGEALPGAAAPSVLRRLAGRARCTTCTARPRPPST